ncbi:MAG: hypothetical protein WC635_08685 [Bacteriovorax sp.]
MFSYADRVSFTLYDENDKLINYQPMLPLVIYQFNKARAIAFSSFVCHRTQGSSLTLIFEDKEKYEFRKPVCAYKKI